MKDPPLLITLAPNEAVPEMDQNRGNKCILLRFKLRNIKLFGYCV